MHFLESWNLGAVHWFSLPPVVWLLILLALAFDYLNGLHDAANSIATVVSTRVLTPGQAVIWAAFFNFIAFAVFDLKVADTIGKTMAPAQITNAVIAGTLLAACAWNILTWYWGLPTSSSHALIGGIMGAAMVQAGADSLNWPSLIRTFVFIFVAPIVGLAIGLAVTVAVYWLFAKARPRSVDAIFRKGQLLSAALYSLGHGGNDAQKTMGIILALLYAVAREDPSAFGQGALDDSGKLVHMPTEVVLACHVAMGLGTLMGGWRIVKTMGQRIIRLRPVDGFCAETGAAATLVLTLFGGVPVSTTQTITGSIVGVGAIQRLSAVRWGVAGRVVWAWIVTIPGAALMAAAFTWALIAVFG